MDHMFLTNQQQLAFKVALLPLLRKEYDDAKIMFKSNMCTLRQVSAAGHKYAECIRDIKALAEQM